MDTHTVGMDKLPSAAAQGEQASEPHHADGYIFTGTDPSVQTLDDTVSGLFYKYSSSSYDSMFRELLESSGALRAQELLRSFCLILDELAKGALIVHAARRAW